MTTIFSLIAITTIWCLGIKVVTAEGMALYQWNRFAQYNVQQGKKIWEPLILCPFCMPSIHSVVGYFFLYFLELSDDLRLLFAYPIVVAGASFLTGMLWLIYELLASKKEYYRNIEQLTHWDISDRSYEHKKRMEKSENRNGQPHHR